MATLSPSLAPSSILTFLALTLVARAQLDCLAPHNAARADVGVPPLVWNETLVAYAQRYAQLRKADCKLTHSKGPYGENLAVSSGSTYTCVKSVTKLWIPEKNNYNYAANTCVEGKACGHYKQAVWRSSTQVGCATVVCNNPGTFVICSYSPPGNVVGQRPY